MASAHSLRNKIEPKLLAMGIPKDRASQWSWPLADACFAYDVTEDPELSMLVAQLAHESNMFKAVVESLNYSVVALRKLWQHRFTKEEAKALGRSAGQSANQPEIAEKAYGGRLGNTEPGDGWKYRGRGLIQITGKDNYSLVSKLMGMPSLMDIPEALESPPVAAMASVAWWVNREGLREAAQVADCRAVTRKINGGFNGLEHRQELFSKAKAA